MGIPGYGQVCPFNGHNIGLIRWVGGETALWTQPLRCHGGHSRPKTKPEAIAPRGCNIGGEAGLQPLGWGRRRFVGKN